jgi:DNA repair protein RecO (recombination protein O)
VPEIPRTLRVEAVILRHLDWGEADRLITLFSKEQGKLRAVAKGVRKMRSRKAGHLEPFTRTALLLARGRDLWIITQAETVDAYLKLGQDLLLTGYASYVIEVLDRFTLEEGQNPSIYSLLVQTLRRLTNGDEPFIVVRYYEIRLLELLGFRPQLFQCVRCNSEIKPQNQFFSAEMGGVVCPDCSGGISPLRAVSLEALRYLRYFQRSSYEQALKAFIPAEVQNEIEGLLQYYITYLLERGLNTPSFLRQVKIK